MPVKFTSKTGGASPLAHLQQAVRDHFGFPADASVAVLMNATTVRHHGIVISLPIGVAHVKSGDSLDEVRAALASCIGAASPAPVSATPATFPSATHKGGATKSFSDMTDEEWVEHVAGSLFPGVLHLHQATELYQAVVGTSSGSVYKTCFIGPDLRVAARIKHSSVSFRATTPENKCPGDEVLSVLKRLGFTSVYEDRVTCHSSMTGSYESEPHEYRALFGAMYAALRPHLTSNFPAIGKLTEGVK